MCAEEKESIAKTLMGGVSTTDYQARYKRSRQEAGERLVKMIDSHRIDSANTKNILTLNSPVFRNPLDKLLFSNLNKFTNKKYDELLWGDVRDMMDRLCYSVFSAIKESSDPSLYENIQEEEQEEEGPVLFNKGFTPKKDEEDEEGTEEPKEDSEKPSSMLGDPKFHRVAFKFFYTLYWNNEIHARLVKRNVLTNELEDYDDVPPGDEEPYIVEVQLLSKLSGNDANGKPIFNRFIDINTSKEYTLVDGMEVFGLLWDGNELRKRFQEVFDFTYKFLIMDKLVFMNFLISSKAVKYNTISGAQKLEDIQETFLRPHAMIITQVGGDDSEFSVNMDATPKPLDLRLPDDVLKLQHFKFMELDRGLDLLGIKMVDNNPKKERGTVGENYKDFKGYNDIINSTLNQLTYWVSDMKKKWPNSIHWDFKLASELQGSEKSEDAEKEIDFDGGDSKAVDGNADSNRT